MPRSPFPGMDPYLESPTLWPDVHDSLMGIYREQLAPLLAPKYVAELHPQIVIEQLDDEASEPLPALPDVAVIRPDMMPMGAVGEATIAAAPLRLRAPIAIPQRIITLNILQRENEKLVTVIELLSPVNKRPGPKRQAYLKKRTGYLDSSIHLVEIDLLRKWPRMPLLDPIPSCDYLVIIRNAYDRLHCDVWTLKVRQPLPVLPIPLLRPDPDVPLDMGKALQTAYERARYDLRIDYRKPPTSPLSPSDAEWATTLLAQSIT